MSTNSPDFTSWIWKFSIAYRPMHGWLATLCCLFGIPCNLLNIIVLTRPNMIKSATNLILTGLAMTDLITMIVCLPQIVYFYIIKINYQEAHPNRETRFWVTYQKYYVIISVTFHSISIWLTVYLACYRFIFLKTASPLHSKNSVMSMIKKRIEPCILKCRTYNSTIIAMILISIFCILFCLPAYIYPQVVQIEYLPKNNLDNLNLFTNNLTKQYIYLIGESHLSKLSNGTIYNSMFYTQAILGKLVPCLLLVTFSFLLIHSLVVINRNNKKLNRTSTRSKALAKQKQRTNLTFKSLRASLKKPAKRNRNRENLRTTLMLVVVCVLFLITELPQCFLLILSYDPKFYEQVYMPLGDLMDILALFNNSINFLFYCTMSKAFRETFDSIITSSCAKPQKLEPRFYLDNNKNPDCNILPREKAAVIVINNKHIENGSNELNALIVRV